MKPLDPPAFLPETVLGAYAQGFFPMADTLDPDTIIWFNPPRRAIMPIEGLHIPRKLRALALKSPFEIRVDTAFDAVIAACAAPTESRTSTWINDDIRQIFSTLHQIGYAHSVESWQDGKLVGGVYGLALGGAFCGESMFSRTSNASKIALIHLCARLSAAGFTLLDCQMLNDHTARFGAYEIAKTAYLPLLTAALQKPCDFLLTARNPSETALIEEFLKKNLTIS